MFTGGAPSASPPQLVLLPPLLLPSGPSPPPPLSPPGPSPPPPPSPSCPPLPQGARLAEDGGPQSKHWVLAAAAGGGELAAAADRIFWASTRRGLAAAAARGCLAAAAKRCCVAATGRGLATTAAETRGLAAAGGRGVAGNAPPHACYWTNLQRSASEVRVSYCRICATLPNEHTSTCVSMYR